MASHSAARVAARAASSPAERAWRTASVASSSRRASGRSSVEAIDSLAVTSAISVPCPSGSTDLALEQADLLAVEQPDLESGGPAAQAERGAGEQGGAPGPAGALGRLAEPRPAAVQVPPCEPGGSPPQRGAGLPLVARPQRPEAGRRRL